MSQFKFKLFMCSSRRCVHRGSHWAGWKSGSKDASMNPSYWKWFTAYFWFVPTIRLEVVQICDAGPYCYFLPLLMWFCIKHKLSLIFCSKYCVISWQSFYHPELLFDIYLVIIIIFIFSYSTWCSQNWGRKKFFFFLV